LACDDRRQYPLACVRPVDGCRSGPPDPPEPSHDPDCLRWTLHQLCLLCRRREFRRFRRCRAGLRDRRLFDAPVHCRPEGTATVNQMSGSVRCTIRRRQTRESSPNYCRRCCSRRYRGRQLLRRRLDHRHRRPTDRCVHRLRRRLHPPVAGRTPEPRSTRTPLRWRQSNTCSGSLHTLLERGKATQLPPTSVVSGVFSPILSRISEEVVSFPLDDLAPKQDIVTLLSVLAGPHPR
jgi:hypothetical protein